MLTFPIMKRKCKHSDVQVDSDVKTEQLFSSLCNPERLFHIKTVCNKVCTHVIIIPSHNRPPTLSDRGPSRRLILIGLQSSEIWRSLFRLIVPSMSDKLMPSFSGHSKYRLCLRRGGSKFLWNFGKKCYTSNVTSLNTPVLKSFCYSYKNNWKLDIRSAGIWCRITD
jgi:hypothetical protein